MAAIQAVDGVVIEGKQLRAAFGTTKYCSFFLRGMKCTVPDCMYLHDLGPQGDSFTKEDLATGKMAMHVKSFHQKLSSGQPPHSTSQVPFMPAAAVLGPSLV